MKTTSLNIFLNRLRFVIFILNTPSPTTKKKLKLFNKNLYSFWIILTSSSSMPKVSTLTTTASESTTLRIG